MTWVSVLTLMMASKVGLLMTALPVAFVFLLLTLLVGKNHVFPWTHEAYPVPEKATYYNPTFLTTRDIVIFGLMTLMGWWYVYTSLRLDVGRIPEGGASWARGSRLWAPIC